ncbi:class I SAM-dependent methyltransferase [Paenibacillus alvei]|uniref:Class I SAM-dependent methyltransferase n=2 Tax=Paenibacillus alvei TaxID=44250 RepID=A0AAP7DHC2_PAEAL|nr:class I SAM-dependent methyltransferase [Paenibacillus alvei]
MTNFKAALAQAYDQDAQRRSSKSLRSWKINERAAFCHLVKHERKSTLLEIGAGTGIDSAYFQQNRIQVTCIDLSNESVKKCVERGLNAKVMDFYHMSFPEHSFEAIYALNCLLHAPKKDLAQILQGINRVLAPNGLLFIGLYGGYDSEGMWEKDWCDPKRFFSFHTDESIQQVISRWFQIEDFHTVPVDDDKLHFQSFTLRKC